MIPADLVPPWRHIPPLAWLAAGAFTISRGPLGRAVLAAGWLVYLGVFIRAKAQRQLAAWHRSAVLIVSERPAQARWRGHLAVVASMPIMVLGLLLPYILMTVAAAAANAAGAYAAGRVLADLAPVALVAPLALMVISVLPALRLPMLRDTAAARHWIKDQQEPLVVANTLAAAPTDRHAVTVLVRRLRREADARQLAILALAGNDCLAEDYRQLGFQQILPGHPRVLHRTPRASR